MLSARAVNWLPFPVALKMSTFFSLLIFFLNCTYLYILYFIGPLQKLWIPSSCYTCGLKWVLYVSSDKQEIIEIFPFKYKLRISSLKGDFCVTTIKMSYYWVLMTQWRFLFLCRSSSASWGWAWLLCHGSAPAICHLFHTVQSSPFWPPRPVAQWSRWCGKSLLIYNENTP